MRRRYHGRMWRPFLRPTGSTPSAGASVEAADDPRRRLIAEAFRAIAGVPSGVIYDLPESLRPRPIPGSIFVRGEARWRSYLDAREEVDSGEPTVLIALRVLDDEERHLAVDWGTTYANTFLLIEPRDWRCDLSDPANAYARRLDEAIEATSGDPGAPDSPLVGYLRGVFGTWRCWGASASSTRGITLDLAGDEATLWGVLRDELAARFPETAFDRSLNRLYVSDRELFVGPVTRARSVFRTRLGLPVLYDAQFVDRAVRRMVNRGAMRVAGLSLPGRPAFGWGRPVPDEVRDEEFAQFVMI